MSGAITALYYQLNLQYINDIMILLLEILISFDLKQIHSSLKEFEPNIPMLHFSRCNHSRDSTLN